MVGLMTESGAFAAKIIRQFELGGMAVISETFIVATSSGAGSIPDVGSAEYRTERISRASSTGRTAVPPS